MLFEGTGNKLYSLVHFVIGKRGLPLAGNGGVYGTRRERTEWIGRGQKARGQQLTQLGWAEPHQYETFGTEFMI
jgi:hypothetical protein